VLEQLQQDNPEGSHGLISTAALVKIAASVLIRSVKRLIEKTDHGVYTTVVEELLRSLYADRVGRYLWDNMKNRTQQAFLDNTDLSGPALHGGTYFLNKLSAHLSAHPDFKLSLVGHSAGGIYICRFIASAAQQVPQLNYQNVIMLAPGCTFDLFRSSILPNQAHIQAFHLFALKDELEAKNAIASVIYPRSLLYFVSGVLEGDAEMPLVGMQRFYSGFAPYNKPELLEVRAYVTAPGQTIWSIADESGAGLKSMSKGHGDFDNDPLTLHSVVSLLGA
jgi:pimeloyl-ACP methyl ester carboxylesterase